MLKKMIAGLALSIAALSPVMAADDPSMHEVYEAANSGHLAQAQEMIATVLRDHPGSAKAHYVAAELDARQGQIGGAREQFQAAERLAPGLPFAKPEAVQALRAELGVSGQSSHAGGPVSTGGGASMGTMVVIGLGIALAIFLLLRLIRRPNPVGYAGGYPAPAGGYPPAGGMPSSGLGAGPGLGSGIVGGLASGLAVGAGVVAGEALMHRVLDGGDRGVDRDRLADSSLDDRDNRGNADMGGNDFGVADSGSWDDSSSSSADSGGGGDDWS